MPVLNIFKKKKRTERIESKKPKKKETRPKKIERVKEKVEKKEVEKKPPVPQMPKPRRDEVKVASKVLQSPQITEKATNLQDKGQYVFKVTAASTKPEIKKAIEEVYGVDILKVRTIKVPRRQRRLGRTTGWKKGYKKAIVSLKKGQSIEVLPR